MPEQDRRPEAQQTRLPAKKPPRSWPWVTVLWVIVICTAGGFSLTHVGAVEARVLAALEWTQGLGLWGPVAFALLYIPVCVTCFPDLLPNAAAGALWGIGWGAATVSIGRLLGATITFALVRTVARGWQERKMAGDPRFAALSQAIAREGFKIVLLARLCPIFPVNVLNYALGLTPVSLRAYATATLLGLLPRTAVVCYAGSGARSLSDLAAGNTQPSGAQSLLFWGGLVVTLAVVALIVRMARRMLQQATEDAR